MLGGEPARASYLGGTLAMWDKLRGVSVLMCLARRDSVTCEQTDLCLWHNSSTLSLAPSGGEIPVLSRWPLFDLKSSVNFFKMVLSHFTSLITLFTPQGPPMQGFLLLLVWSPNLPWCFSQVYSFLPGNKFQDLSFFMFLHECGTDWWTRARCVRFLHRWSEITRSNFGDWWH